MIKQNKHKAGDPFLTLSVDYPTFEALIRCRNELYNVYQQFGGDSSIHLSKGLSADVDWTGVNAWEIANMGSDETAPKKKAIPQWCIDVDAIVNDIMRSTSVFGAIGYLNNSEIKTRIESYFEDDGIEGSDKLVSVIDGDRFEDLGDLIVDLESTFGVNLGKDVEWLNYITVSQMLEVLVNVKNRVKK